MKEYPDAINFIRETAGDNSSPLCEACIIGKSKRRPFVNISTNRYTSLEAVSTDTTGPILQQDIDGNKYFQLLADAGTRHMTDMAMKNKGAVPGAIIKALACLQVLCGRTAKRLHTDGARKQDTPEVRQFLSAQGTRHTKTAPSSSQSNSIFGQRFKSMFANARDAMLTAPHLLNTDRYWSLSALDSIIKANYMPFKRHGALQPSPHTAKQLHGCNNDILGGCNSFLPYGKAVFIVETRKIQNKLDNRAVRANYIRCLTKSAYQIFRRGTMKITTPA
eukprot:Plantae.Rhodophyta-Palmaria_palmata.ctg5670.p1 GENE.Plantae.Rhodophyta-Palmaria_palmata.ctg5670~~Plantae.Rhodophyta-Palmaria_palmata.ctg5670.p1  ORF type:complete len:277 (+),score=-5.77 Plantae.Rhodophyta-Palmaria_palmata.ctg5670:508-1338(+)